MYCSGFGEKRPIEAVLFLGDSSFETNPRTQIPKEMTRIIIFQIHIGQCDLSLEVFSTSFWRCQLGGRIFFSNKTVQTTSIIPGKGMLVLPSSSLSLKSSCLVRNSGKEQDVSDSAFFSNKVCHLLKTKMPSSPCMINTQVASPSFGLLSHW